MSQFTYTKKRGRSMKNEMARTLENRLGKINWDNTKREENEDRLGKKVMKLSLHCQSQTLEIKNIEKWRDKNKKVKWKIWPPITLWAERNLFHVVSFAVSVSSDRNVGKCIARCFLSFFFQSSNITMNPIPSLAFRQPTILSVQL